MSSDRRTFILAHLEARRRALECVQQAPQGYAVSVGEPTRTIEQNAKQWPYLAGFSQQLQWNVGGEMVWMSEDEWKDVLTAAFFGDTVRLAKGLDSGVVMLGLRTSKFSQRQFREWMAFLKATAAIRGVTPVYADEEQEA